MRGWSGPGRGKKGREQSSVSNQWAEAGAPFCFSWNGDEFQVRYFSTSNSEEGAARVGSVPCESRLRL